MSETNGHPESRLDRIEAILDRHSNMFVGADAAMERHRTVMASIEAAMERHRTMIVSIDAGMDNINKSIDRQILANEAAHQRF